MIPHRIVVLAVVMAALGLPSRAFAQIDLSGVWAPIN